MTQVRQGDVLIRSVKNAIRQGTPIADQGRVILAYGEATGHAHEVIADDLTAEATIPAALLFEQPDGRRYLFIDRRCLLVHQEHGCIALTPGAYEVIRQREYSPEAIRNVAD